MQFLENLSDRQAAEAVRSRIDWKYLLGLELTDAGFDYSVLCLIKLPGLPVLLSPKAIFIFRCATNWELYLKILILLSFFRVAVIRH
jgi:hypothetical protein